MLLSEMFGVEREVDFGVKGYSVIFKITALLGKYEYLMYKWSAALDWREAEGTMLCSIISGAPANIIHLPPPLTDEQRDQLKAIWTLGGRWLAKNANSCVYAYSVEPEKNRNWNEWVPVNYNEHIVRFAICRDLDVCSLVSWSDDEPYDIGKAIEIKLIWQ